MCSLSVVLASGPLVTPPIAPSVPLERTVSDAQSSVLLRFLLRMGCSLTAPLCLAPHSPRSNSCITTHMVKVGERSISDSAAEHRTMRATRACLMFARRPIAPSVLTSLLTRRLVTSPPSLPCGIFSVPPLYPSIFPFHVVGMKQLPRTPIAALVNHLRW